MTAYLARTGSGAANSLIHLTLGQPAACGGHLSPTADAKSLSQSLLVTATKVRARYDGLPIGRAAGGYGGSSPRDNKGMLPCFFGGRVSRLVRRLRSALVTAARVSAGRITASR